MTETRRSAVQRSRGAEPRCVLAAFFVAILCATACASDERSHDADAVPWDGPDPIERIDAFIAEHPVDKSNPAWKSDVPRPPFVQFDPARKYYWYLSTDAGMLKIELKPEWSPNHVSTAIYLTRLGFYDGLTFHRVIPGFMAQGGDPLGTGRGGPGFHIAGEFHKKALHEERGAVSAANRGPRTDGSQFFITFKAADQLDGRHTVYGQVVEGMGTLRSLESIGTERGEPKEIVRIRRARISVE